MTGPFVRTWVIEQELGSTSDLARTLIGESGVDYPLLVLARRQTQGRGRGSHSWWSDQGSLTFTLALNPAAQGLRLEHQPRVALAVAVALVDTLAPIVRQPERLGIRWPNDVESDGRKLAGVLPERVDTPEGARLLIGLGLNVTTRLDDAPPEVRRMATSVHELTLIEPSTIDAILGRLLDRLPPVFDQLAANDPSLADRWASLDALRGKALRLDLGGRVLQAVGHGIDPEGALVLKTGAGVDRHFGGQVLREVND